MSRNRYTKVVREAEREQIAVQEEQLEALIVDLRRDSNLAAVPAVVNEGNARRRVCREQMRKRMSERKPVLSMVRQCQSRASVRSHLPRSAGPKFTITKKER